MTRSITTVGLLLSLLVWTASTGSCREELIPIEDLYQNSSVFMFRGMQKKLKVLISTNTYISTAQFEERIEDHVVSKLKEEGFQVLQVCKLSQGFKIDEFPGVPILKVSFHEQCASPEGQQVWSYRLCTTVDEMVTLERDKKIVVQCSVWETESYGCMPREKRIETTMSAIDQQMLTFLKDFYKANAAPVKAPKKQAKSS